MTGDSGGGSQQGHFDDIDLPEPSGMSDIRPVISCGVVILALVRLPPKSNGVKTEL